MSIQDDIAALRTIIKLLESQSSNYEVSTIDGNVIALRICDELETLQEEKEELMEALALCGTFLEGLSTTKVFDLDAGTVVVLDSLTLTVQLLLARLKRGEE